MNIKPYAYHWTCASQAENILEKGILPSGGLHATAVYMSADPCEFYGRPSYDTLFAVHLRGLEKNIRSLPDKQWLLSLAPIPKENLIYVGSNFNEESEVREALRKARDEHTTKNPRAHWPIRTERIKPLHETQRTL